MNITTFNLTEQLKFQLSLGLLTVTNSQDRDGNNLFN